MTLHPFCLSKQLGCQRYVLLLLQCVFIQNDRYNSIIQRKIKYCTQMAARCKVTASEVIDMKIYYSRSVLCGIWISLLLAWLWPLSICCHLTLDLLPANQACFWNHSKSTVKLFIFWQNGHLYYHIMIVVPDLWTIHIDVLTQLFPVSKKCLHDWFISLNK